ncbi:hypothetical protein EWM64_g4114, partial [Hericium alpestre]
MADIDQDKTIIALSPQAQSSLGSVDSEDSISPYYSILPPLLRPLPSKASPHSREALSTIPPMTELSGLLMPVLPRPLPPVFAIGYPISLEQIDSLSRGFDPEHPVDVKAWSGSVSMIAMSRARSALINACGCKVLDLTFIINHPTGFLASLGDSYHTRRLEREVQMIHI